MKVDQEFDNAILEVINVFYMLRKTFVLAKLAVEVAASMLAVDPLTQ